MDPALHVPGLYVVPLMASPRAWGAHPGAPVHTREDGPQGEPRPVCRLGHLNKECWGSRCPENNLEDWTSSLLYGERTWLKDGRVAGMGQASKSQSPGHGPWWPVLRAAPNLLRAGQPFNASVSRETPSLTAQPASELGRFLQPLLGPPPRPGSPRGLCAQKSEACSSVFPTPPPSAVIYISELY